MFLEKFSRFFRRYNLRISARAKSAAVLPLAADAGQPSILDALNAAKKAGGLSEAQSNDDLVELVAIEHDKKAGALTLLFHRTSPEAADPTYRKKAKDKIELRHATKMLDE